MQVFIKADYDEMSKKAAEILAGEMKKKKNFVLGLATGSTPIGLYKELIRMNKEGSLDFSGVVTFNLDEYYGLEPAHPQSYRYFMNEQLFDHINIDKKNTFVPDGLAKEPERYCREYEKLIVDKGGIDLQVLGIGADGHIGFNEPGSSLGSRTRLKVLNEQTVQDNARFFENIGEVPGYAITMGVGTVMDARACLLVANGAKKAQVVASAVEGPVTAEITASVLQMHPRVFVVLDEPASGGLKRKDYYKHIEKMVGEFKPV